MKKLALMTVAVLITTLTFAQKVSEKDVPVAVKNTLQKAFPTAKEIKWDKEGSNYEAGFDLNKIDYSVLLDTQGKVVATEMEIEINQLPKGVAEYIASHYKGHKVKEAAKITDAKGVVTYEAEIKGMDLIFDSNRKFMKEIKD